MSFHHNESRIYELYAKSTPGAVLSFIQSLSSEAREESRFFDYAEANLLVMSGATEKALELLDKVAESGGWIRPSLLEEDPDFAPLLGHGRFERLSDLYQKRYEEALRSTAPTKSVLSPSTDSFGRHILLVLHGDNSGAAHSLNSWEPAAKLGWTVVALQSGELGDFDGAYRWSSLDATRTAVIETLKGISTGSEEAVVLGGFSRGGEMALKLAVEGVGESRRAMAVCPAPMREALGPASPGGSRLGGCYIFAGREDGQYDAAVSAARELSALGAAVTLDERDGYGHEFPSDFAAVLSRYLKDPEISGSKSSLSSS